MKSFHPGEQVPSGKPIQPGEQAPQPGEQAPGMKPIHSAEQVLHPGEQASGMKSIHSGEQSLHPSVQASSIGALHPGEQASGMKPMLSGEQVSGMKFLHLREQADQKLEIKLENKTIDKNIFQTDIQTSEKFDVSTGGIIPPQIPIAFDSQSVDQSSLTTPAAGYMENPYPLDSRDLPLDNPFMNFMQPIGPFVSNFPLNPQDM